MKLTSNKGNITGKYFYKSVGDNLRLSGSLDTAGNLFLDERNSEGKLMGHFKGKFVGDKMTGEWTNDDDSSKFNFELTESKENYELIQESLLENLDRDKNLIKTGFYRILDLNLSYAHIKVTRVNKRKLKFDLDIAEYNNDCHGSLDGILTLNEKGIAVYSAPGCNKVMFSFTPDAITIKELGECDEHLKGCSFDGLYEFDEWFCSFWKRIQVTLVKKERFVVLVRA